MRNDLVYEGNPMAWNNGQPGLYLMKEKDFDVWRYESRYSESVNYNSVLKR